MKNITLNCRRMRTRRLAHRYLKQRLHFPAWAGASLDALYDLLSANREPLTLTLLHADELTRLLGPYGEGLKAVLLDVAAHNASVKVILA